MRIATGGLVMWLVVLRYEMPTNLSEVLNLFARRDQAPPSWIEEDAEVDRPERASVA
jgi:hypothetical protein